VPYVVVPRSSEPRHHRCSPWVAARLRRRFGEPLLSSRVRARRFGEDPAANGAPQRCFLVAPRSPSCAAAPRFAAGRPPPPAACARPEPSDEHPVVQDAPSPVNVFPYQSTQCLRSPPLDLDPTDPIHSLGLTALFCLKAPGFPYFTKISFHLRESLQIGPILFSLARKLMFYLQISPKTCFSRNLVVLAPF
jgi:hypothetical protein